MNPDLREKYKPLKIGLQIFPQLIRLSENPLCKYQVAPDMAMTVGMTMVLPPSHSPATQDHAMGAALSERQLG